MQSGWTERWGKRIQIVETEYPCARCGRYLTLMLCELKYGPHTVACRWCYLAFTTEYGCLYGRWSWNDIKADRVRNYNEYDLPLFEQYHLKRQLMVIPQS